MKKKLLIASASAAAVVLMLLCLFSAMGQPDNSITFYYRRTEFRYGQQSSVIGGEKREISGYSRELTYLLSLYMEGPLDDSLTAPFPASAGVLNAVQDGGLLMLELTGMPENMTDAQFSLACACLTRTCLELTDAHTVRITSGGRSLRMNSDNLILYDNSSSAEIPKTEEEQ